MSKIDTSTDAIRIMSQAVAGSAVDANYGVSAALWALVVERDMLKETLKEAADLINDGCYFSAEHTIQNVLEGK
jgi:hypothetical protein